MDARQTIRMCLTVENDSECGWEMKGEKRWLPRDPAQ